MIGLSPGGCADELAPSAPMAATASMVTDNPHPNPSLCKAPPPQAMLAQVLKTHGWPCTGDPAWSKSPVAFDCDGIVRSRCPHPHEFQAVALRHNCVGVLVQLFHQIVRNAGVRVLLQLIVENSALAGHRQEKLMTMVADLPIAIDYVRSTNCFLPLRHSRQQHLEKIRLA
jgi:hypothetical protein